MLVLENHAAQVARWPQRGRHVMAQFDESSIVVYQAYRPSIGHAAVRDQRFGGGGWSFDRMSWIKPNFLWMMYRCGWALKEGQEVVLAITLARAFFDGVVARAATNGPGDVRLQWDPDHAPSGRPVERRAIQLGLRGAALREYATPIAIEDITPLVAAQREHRASDALMTPREDVYPITAPDL